MDSERWNRIQEIFHAAADLPKGEQRAFLNAACHDDPSLIPDIEALLEVDAQGSSLLDRDVAHVAEEILREPESGRLPFEKLGPYRLGALLGHGGMGVVYLAQREDLGSLVAIKVLRDAWLSPARRERFASEQRTLAQLNHPSIARLYDAGTLPDGSPWFVMEYAEGLPLTQYCRDNHSTLEERLNLFRAVCEAVQYAHGQAVIHRDLKPSNILVKSDGGVRLLDFGIAKQLENMETPADQTITGLRLMTPAYASPEQICGETLGVQTDVYSLGVILYELLAGKLPFDLSSLKASQAEAVILEKEPEKPSAARGGEAVTASKAAWADLDVLCLTALHKDPQRRYRSVEALVRDVDHFLKREPLEARADTLGYRAAKFLRRNRSAVTAGAVVSALIVGLVIFYTARLTRARNAALAEAARTERVQRFMQNLFQGGDEDAGPADDLRVVTLLDRGVQQAGMLDHDPAQQAELYQTLGNIYDQLGKLDQAETLLNSALEKRQAQFGADSPEAAESLEALSLLKADKAEFDSAEQLARQSLAMYQRHLPPNHPAVARAMGTLGRVLIDRGQYAQAIPVLEETVRLQSAPGGVTSDLAMSITHLANCKFYVGDYAASDALNRRALEMDRRLFGERHPNVGEDYINLGAIQFEWGHYPEAELYDRKALDIFQAWAGKDHPETASVMTILGRALVAEGKLDEAAGTLQRALQIQERVYGKVHPRVASTVSELGRVALQEGNLDEAESDFNRAANIWKSVYNGKHYYIGGALANLGGVYMERKDYARAEAYYREALQMYAQTLPAEHKLAGVAHARLGRALLRQKRYTEAETESRAGYLILVKQANLPPEWLQNARVDLAEEYAAMNQPETAAKFRSELAGAPSAAAASRPATAKK